MRVELFGIANVWIKQFWNTNPLLPSIHSSRVLGCIEITWSKDVFCYIIVGLQLETHTLHNWWPATGNIYSREQHHTMFLPFSVFLPVGFGPFLCMVIPSGNLSRDYPMKIIATHLRPAGFEDLMLAVGGSDALPSLLLCRCRSAAESVKCFLFVFLAVWWVLACFVRFISEALGFYRRDTSYVV